MTTFVLRFLTVLTLAIGQGHCASVLAAPRAAQQPAGSDLTGRWTLAVESPHHGPMSFTVALAQEGANVTGVLRTEHDDVAFKGQLVGDELTLRSSAGDHHPEILIELRLSPRGTLDGWVSHSTERMEATASRTRH